MEHYLDKVPALPALANKSMLCLDIGRRTGWAYVTETGQRDSGVHELYDAQGHIKNYEDGKRFQAFRDFVSTLDEQVDGFDLIAFEQVNGGTKGRQTVLYNGYRAVLMAWCDQNNRLVIPVPVNKLKQFATGNGRADKNHMISACKMAGFLPFDDNEADAICLREFAVPRIRKDQEQHAKLYRANDLGRKAVKEGNGGAGRKRAPRKRAKHAKALAST